MGRNSIAHQRSILSFSQKDYVRALAEEIEGAVKRSDAERAIMKKQLTRTETAVKNLTTRVEEKRKELKLKKKEVEAIRAKVNSRFIAPQKPVSKVTKPRSRRT